MQASTILTDSLKSEDPKTVIELTSSSNYYKLYIIAKLTSRYNHEMCIILCLYVYLECQTTDFVTMAFLKICVFGTFGVRLLLSRELLQCLRISTRSLLPEDSARGVHTSPVNSVLVFMQNATRYRLSTQLHRQQNLKSLRSLFVATVV